MDTRCHEMPFGSSVLNDRSVRFRLWAPAAGGIDLCLADNGHEILLPMLPKDGGWYECITDAASNGSLYRYLIDGQLRVPDPASRFQPDDVHGFSQVIDPVRWHWEDGYWQSRPWNETVIYELHTGSFTKQGDFQGIISRLDYLKDLGITAIELMPISDFPGKRNWGYDGVLPFAPDNRYGTPDDLKQLIQSAHGTGLMVFLDVVYNHFGPDGNFLAHYAPAFFTENYHTPWGAAINFDGRDSRTVRDFFIHNALFWLEEYHLDGLRLDAVHAIFDSSVPDILEELAQAVRDGPGRHRHIHLVLENDHNEARYLARTDKNMPKWYQAQWNDDLHHALHVLSTNETSGYYRDFADRPAWYLGRALSEGFAWQGEPSPYRHGEPRGTPSAHLPSTALIGFLQNHDQIGNRAFGERITRLAGEKAIKAVTAIILLAPAIPLLFMGQEWGTGRPFPFFCDFEGELGKQISQGRLSEFSRFPEFAEPDGHSCIPDPNDPWTFAQALLDWEACDQYWLAFHKELLAVRHNIIIPLLDRIKAGSCRFHALSDRVLIVEWPLDKDEWLILYVNLDNSPYRSAPALTDRPFYLLPQGCLDDAGTGVWSPWMTAWCLTGRSAGSFS